MPPLGRAWRQWQKRRRPAKADVRRARRRTKRSASCCRPGRWGVLPAGDHLWPRQANAGALHCERAASAWGHSRSPRPDRVGGLVIIGSDSSTRSPTDRGSVAQHLRFANPERGQRCPDIATLPKCGPVGSGPEPVTESGPMAETMTPAGTTAAEADATSSAFVRALSQLGHGVPGHRRRAHR